MQEVFYTIRWWIPIFIIGIIFLPITTLIFKKFYDRGYLFSKVIGIGIISYSALVLGEIKLLPFSVFTLFLIIWAFILINLKLLNINKIREHSRLWKIFILEEILFFGGILLWSFVRSHEPSINGLEKFMDFGFLNSILRSSFFPPTDMWFPPFPINYYYFGHLTTAVLTKLSFLPSFVTFNLMIATLFSFCFSLSFSLGSNFISKNVVSKNGIIGGILTGFMVTFGGNLHTIYAFFKAYNVEAPVPLWQLALNISSFPNSYWYPNATRFIPFTIHEFPLYSFVVSDLHGHVLDIMFVLLTIALIYIIYLEKNINKLLLGFISFFLAIMYMTNVWDGAIYLLLLTLVLFIKNLNSKKLSEILVNTSKPLLTIILLFFIFSLPFNYYFKPFAQGFGVLCSPSFLTKIGKIGPFLFEASHCQHSPWWQLLILYGFFYFFVISFLVFLLKFRNKLKQSEDNIFMVALIVLSTFLIIVPEIVYLKDIYPAHYRANTMFKLVYQSFIMLSLVSSFAIVKIIEKTKNIFFYFVTVILVGLVFLYPYFAIRSYYGDFKNRVGLDGSLYLKTRLPDDYKAIAWINKYIKGSPVIVEAQGDSYTDYGRISANTGLPTILGWTVHEWLWRGTYDIPAPRIAEIKDIYESQDINKTKQLLNKYKASYIYVGSLEREKYPELKESKFEKIGKIIFQEGQTKIYSLR